MTTPIPKKRTAAQIRNDKADVLAIATEALSARVGALADAVQVNNALVRNLQQEVNTKPDDEEVKFITGMAAADRKKVRRRALVTAVVSAVVSGFISYGFAWNAQRKEIENRDTTGYSGCTQTNIRTEEIAKAFSNVADTAGPSKQDSPVIKSINASAVRINKLKRDCETLYPDRRK